MKAYKQIFKIQQPYVKGDINVLDNASVVDSFRYSTFGFNSLLQKNATRLSLYNTFNDMDSDPDINRILNTFADEICTENDDGDPFNLVFNTTDANMMDNQMVEILNNLLVKWLSITKLRSKIFDIVRQTIKYGDCFFAKLSDLEEWIYIPTSDVTGVELGENAEIIKYYITLNHYSRLSHIFNTDGKDNITQIVIPSENVVHFSLSNMMNNEAPFGDSVLFPALKYYKYLIMLESSVLIYRIVRSPERRKFKIFTGNMPDIKKKAYVEQLKRELYQKRVNAQSEGSIDSIYNAMSIGEDFFFTVDKNGAGSDVETMPGGQSLGELDDVMYFRHKINNCVGVPTSYINPTAGGEATVRDGKVGIAYIEEQRFNSKIMRIQRKLEPVFDAEFKSFIASCDNLNIDTQLFRLEMPTPQNFALYRQIELEREVSGTFNSMVTHKFLSKRFCLEKFLKLSKEEINTNEILLKEELGMANADNDITTTQLVYDDKCMEQRSVTVPIYKTYNSDYNVGVNDNMNGDMGGMPMGGGGDFGFGDFGGGNESPVGNEPVAEPGGEGNETPAEPGNELAHTIYDINNILLD